VFAKEQAVEGNTEATENFPAQTPRRILHRGCRDRKGTFGVKGLILGVETKPTRLDSADPPPVGVTNLKNSLHDRSGFRITLRSNASPIGDFDPRGTRDNLADEVLDGKEDVQWFKP
jgi:hypothetical protein